MRTIKYIELNQQIIQKIKDVLYKKNISRSRLADEIGVSKGTISQYLNGNIKNIGEDIFDKIVNVLEVDKKSLLKQNIIIEESKNNFVINESKFDYNNINYSAPVDLNLFLLLAKYVNEVFNEESFKNTFSKSIDEFFRDFGKGCLDYRVLKELKYAGKDMNELFENKTFKESFEVLLGE